MPAGPVLYSWTPTFDFKGFLKSASKVVKRPPDRSIVKVALQNISHRRLVGLLRWQIRINCLSTCLRCTKTRFCNRSITMFHGTLIPFQYVGTSNQWTNFKHVNPLPMSPLNNKRNCRDVTPFTPSIRSSVSFHPCIFANLMNNGKTKICTPWAASFCSNLIPLFLGLLFLCHPYFRVEIFLCTFPSSPRAVSHRLHQSSCSKAAPRPCR